MAVRDVMAFYTPPSLREYPENISLPQMKAKPIQNAETTATLNSTMDQYEDYDFNDTSCYDQTPPPKEKSKPDQLADSVAAVASSFPAYLSHKSKEETLPTPSVANPFELKYWQMWSNLDKLVSKLDEDTVDELNVQFTNIIGAALKKKRESL